MISTAELKNHTKADLTAIAKRLGLEGVSGLRKDDLVQAVAKAQRAKSKPGKPRAKSAAGSAAKKNGKAAPSTKVKAASKSSASTAKASAKSAGAKSRSAGVTAKASGSKSSTRKAGTSAKLTATAAKETPSKRSAKAAKKSDTSKLSTSKGPTGKQSAPEKKARGKKEVVSAKPKRLAAKEKKPAKKSTTSPRVLKKIRELQLQKAANKDIAFRPTLVKPPGAGEPIWEKEPQKDRVALFVRDAYWLQAAWDITRSAIERAKAALAEQWHSATPVLRVLRLDDKANSTAESVERDVEIHGGLRNWYIDWDGEPARVRVLIGYKTANDRFHAIAESNIVTTPEAGSGDDVDTHWADSGADSERIFSLSGGYDKGQETNDMEEMLEQRLRRELGAPALTKLGAGTGADAPFRRRGDFHFDMDIELVLYGSTTPDTYLTLSGEPVALRPDGTFVMRLPFPDKRQVLPAVACSRDGTRQRTIVVAVERNTKVMEPLDSERDTGE